MDTPASRLPHAFGVGFAPAAGREVTRESQCLDPAMLRTERPRAKLVTAHGPGWQGRRRGLEQRGMAQPNASPSRLPWSKAPPPAKRGRLQARFELATGHSTPPGCQHTWEGLALGTESLRHVLANCSDALCRIRDRLSSQNLRASEPSTPGRLVAAPAVGAGPRIRTSTRKFPIRT